MDIKSMRCFLAVAETLNFSRAAESIYLSQPALSLRINAMEDELGAKLFLRTRQQVYLPVPRCCRRYRRFWPGSTRCRRSSVPARALPM